MKPRTPFLCALALAASLSLTAATPIAPVPAYADARVAVIQLRIAPDHRDWSYKLGEPVRFRITVTADSTPVDNATVTYSVGPDLFPGEKKTAVVPLDGLVVDGGTMNVGGFLRLKASVELMSGFAAPFRTKAPTPTFAMMTRSPAATLPCA